jgi:hypothetical protein
MHKEKRQQQLLRRTPYTNLRQALASAGALFGVGNEMAAAD